jgi:hypothetical protein
LKAAAPFSVAGLGRYRPTLGNPLEMLASRARPLDAEQGVIATVRA